MKVEPENVSGEKIEQHVFEHSVEHSVNWSHVLLALVVVYALMKLGPALIEKNDDGK